MNTEYESFQETKSQTSKSNARRQAENLESYQKNFFQNPTKGATKPNALDGTYNVSPNERSSAQTSASKMMAEFRRGTPMMPHN